MMLVGSILCCCEDGVDMLVAASSESLKIVDILLDVKVRTQRM